MTLNTSAEKTYNVVKHPVAGILLRIGVLLGKSLITPPAVAEILKVMEREGLIQEKEPELPPTEVLPELPSVSELPIARSQDPLPAGPPPNALVPMTAAPEGFVGASKVVHRLDRQKLGRFYGEHFKVRSVKAPELYADSTLAKAVRGVATEVGLMPGPACKYPGLAQLSSLSKAEQFGEKVVRRTVGYSVVYGPEAIQLMQDWLDRRYPGTLSG